MTAAGVNVDVVEVHICGRPLENRIVSASSQRTGGWDLGGGMENSVLVGTHLQAAPFARKGYRTIRQGPWPRDDAPRPKTRSLSCNTGIYHTKAMIHPYIHT
jgi:hypothetical protein